LEVQRCLDSSNGQALIEQAKEAYQAGSQRIIVDMRQTCSISTYGFFTLHTIVSLLNNKPLPSTEQGAGSPIISMRSQNKNPKYLLIRNPQPHVAQALLSMGFNDWVEIQFSL